MFFLVVFGAALIGASARHSRAIPNIFFLDLKVNPLIGTWQVAYFHERQAANDSFQATMVKVRKLTLEERIRYEPFTVLNDGALLAEMFFDMLGRHFKLTTLMMPKLNSNEWMTAVLDAATTTPHAPILSIKDGYASVMEIYFDQPFLFMMFSEGKGWGMVLYQGERPSERRIHSGVKDFLDEMKHLPKSPKVSPLPQHTDNIYRKWDSPPKYKEVLPPAPQNDIDLYTMVINYLLN